MTNDNSNDSKISITYETIFELLRREKNRDELQKLTPTFYNDVSSYIAEKNKIFSPDVKNASDADKEKALKQVQNAKRMITELFERREKKILILALNKVRTASAIVDTSAFLPQEKEFFEDSIKMFLYHRQIVLDNFLGEKRNYDFVFQSKPILTNPTQNENVVFTPKIKESPPINTIEKKEPVILKKSNTKMIKILAHIPKFMGKELEVYGPFNPDDMANIPSEIADILIKKGRAEEVSVE